MLSQRTENKTKLQIGTLLQSFTKAREAFLFKFSLKIHSIYRSDVIELFVKNGGLGI